MFNNTPFFPIFSTIEEAVPVNFEVIGRREWFDNCFEKDSIPLHLIREVRRQADLDPILDDLWPRQELGCDTETGGPFRGDKSKHIASDGLDPVSKTSEIVLFQIGHPDKVYVCDPATIPWFKSLLQDPKHTFLFQNGVHDYKFLYAKNKIRIADIYDCMVAEQVLIAGQEGRKVGLVDLARKYPPHYIVNKEVREDFLTWPIIMNWRKIFYGARDVQLLFPIREGQKAQIKALHMARCMRDERRCLPVTAEMELTGVYLDIRVMRRILTYYEKESERLQKLVYDLYNEELARQSHNGKASLIVTESDEETFNLAAPASVVRALARIGIEVPNAQKATMADLDHPIGVPIKEWKECQKILSTYGQNLINQIHRDDGRYHPKFFQHGAGEYSNSDGKNVTVSTATGRYTSNFQQMPRPEKLLEIVDDPEEIQAVLDYFKTVVVNQEAT